MKGGQVLLCLFVAVCFAGAQNAGVWENEWIIGPPETSTAYNYVSLIGGTGEATAKIHETIQVDRASITLQLRFSGTKLPTANTAAATLFEMKEAPGGATLTLIANLDYESSLKSYVCGFTLGTTVKVVIVQVVDDNDNYPLWVDPIYELGPFKENELGVVYELAAADRDAGDNATLEYTWQVLIGDSSHFRMTSEGTSWKKSKLEVIKELDYETEASYLFSITVQDRPGGIGIGQGSLTNFIQVRLLVEDDKDSPPVWIREKPSIHIAEELPIDKEVFSVLAKDGDVSIDDAIVYSIADPRDSLYIEETTGVVRIKQRIDRDVPEFEPSFEVIITASCRNYPDFKSTTQTTVFIDDINDNLPLFSEEVYNFSVDENYAGRLYDFDIQVSDPDLRDNGSYTVRIDGDPSQTTKIHLNPPGGSGTNDASFFLTIDSDLLDYEDPAQRHVTFTLVATEKAPAKRTTSSTVNIYAKDVNDNTPIFLNTEEDQYKVAIVENTDPFSPVVLIQASDADISPEFGNESIRFSFVESFEAARYFTLDSITGEINIAETHQGNIIDREVIGDSLTYTIQATDRGGNNIGLRSYAQLIAKIEDVNDDPPRFASLNVGDVKVGEDKEKDYLVTAGIFALDRDENPSLVLSVNWDKSQFEKDRRILSPTEEWKKTFTFNAAAQQDPNNIEGIIRIGDSKLPLCPTCHCENDCPSSLDRETFDTVILCLTVTDTNTVLNKTLDEIMMTIVIEDVNDNDPVFDPVTKNFSVTENNQTPKDDDLGYVHAVDADVDNVITYSLKCETCYESLPCQNDEEHYVSIDPASGHLVMTQPIDYENIHFLKCEVMASDSGTPVVRSSTIPIIVDVVDVNDNVPVFDPSMITSINIPEYPVSLDADFVLEVLATDADSGDYGIVKYLMDSNNDQGIEEFSVQLDTGTLTIKDAKRLDFEKTRSYRFSVEARDNYRENMLSGSNRVYQPITINLIDVNDNAPELPQQADQCFASVEESLLKDSLAASIKGVDKDEPDKPNSQMTFSLIQQIRLGDPKPDCPTDQLFRMDTAPDKATGLLYSTIDFLNCWGKYNVTVKACDLGIDDRLGQQCSEEAIYTICVTNVNHDPKLIFPNPDGSTVIKVYDNSAVDSVLFHDENELTQMKATDGDEGENGRVSYSWKNQSYEEVFSIESSTGIVVLKKQLDRSQQSVYESIVVAKDNGSPQRSAEATIKIYVRLSNKRNPVFPDGGQQLNFKENELATSDFTPAKDLDNENLYPGEEPYPICYYVACGNSEFFEVPDPSRNQLRTKKELDREVPLLVPYVIIEASNDCSRKDDLPPQSCSGIPISESQYFNVSINVLDAYDCKPEYQTPLSGGITAGDKKGKTVFTLTVTDQDLDDSATCIVENNFTTSGDNLAGIVSPFSIENPSHKVILGFDVSSAMTGHFTMNVSCHDKGDNYGWSLITIYIVTVEHKVTFVFLNDTVTVDNKRNRISEIFTEVYGYLCNIESVSEGELQSDGNPTSDVLSHFVDELKEEPVLSTVIETMKTDANKNAELDRLFTIENLKLKSINAVNTPVDTVQEIFMILFIVTCVILIALVILISYLLIRGSEMNRKVKALSSTKFGSQDSITNRAGAFSIPNTNMHSVEGSNPIWSVEDFNKQDKQLDTISESSGDSILIGVEDDPEFAGGFGVKIGGKTNPAYQPNETNGLPFQTVTRLNPLAELKSNAAHNEEPEVPSNKKRPAPLPPVQTDSSDGDDDEIPNDNFTFGASRMSAF